MSPSMKYPIFDMHVFMSINACNGIFKRNADCYGLLSDQFNPLALGGSVRIRV